MLKQRVLTAAALAPLAVLAILFLPSLWVGGLLLILVLIAGWEWARLMGSQTTGGRVVYLVLLSLSLVTGALLPPWAVFAGAAAWWVVAFGLVLGFRGRPRSAGRLALAMRAVAGILVLVPAWYAIITLHAAQPHGRTLVVLLFALIWLGDIAAYLLGRRYGRHRLIPRVSPGKTHIGLVAELGTTAGVGLVAAWAYGLDWVQGGALAALCLGSAAVSVVGDLFISVMKRGAKVKDSGALLPGHGGMLDRIDSLTAASPVFALGVKWLEIAT